MISGMVVGFTAMVLCLVVQGFLLIMATRYYFGHLSWVKASSRVKAMLLIAQVMLILVLGNLLQGAIWAVLFGSKFVILEAVDIVFGDHVELGKLLEVILIVVVMLAARALVGAFFDWLGRHELPPAAA